MEFKTSYCEENVEFSYYTPEDRNNTEDLEEIITISESLYMERDFTGEYFGDPKTRFAVSYSHLAGDLLGTCDAEGNKVLYGPAHVKHAKSLAETWIHERDHETNPNPDGPLGPKWTNYARAIEEQKADQSFYGPA